MKVSTPTHTYTPLRLSQQQCLFLKHLSLSSLSFLLSMFSFLKKENRSIQRETGLVILWTFFTNRACVSHPAIYPTFSAQVLLYEQSLAPFHIYLPITVRCSAGQRTNYSSCQAASTHSRLNVLRAAEGGYHSPVIILPCWQRPSSQSDENYSRVRAPELDGYGSFFSPSVRPHELLVSMCHVVLIGERGQCTSARQSLQ